MPKSTPYDFRAWRKEMNLTQADAARLLGYAHQPSYARAEKAGGASLPVVKFARELLERRGRK